MFVSAQHTPPWAPKLNSSSAEAYPSKTPGCRSTLTPFTPASPFFFALLLLTASGCAYSRQSLIGAYVDAATSYPDKIRFVENKEFAHSIRAKRSRHVICRGSENATEKATAEAVARKSWLESVTNEIAVRP